VLGVQVNRYVPCTDGLRSFHGMPVMRRPTKIRMACDGW
jgi:hypothetical protein